jgi:hypothetical protein
MFHVPLSAVLQFQSSQKAEEEGCSDAQSNDQDPGKQ